MANKNLPFFTRYSPPPDVEVEFHEPTLTQQHFKDECDINKIIARFDASGMWCDPSMAIQSREPMYGDFANLPKDYLEVQQKYLEANENFMSLPAETRKRFDNDPLNLINFMNTPGNEEEKIALGLMEVPVQNLHPSHTPGTPEYNEIHKENPAPVSPSVQSSNSGQ